MYQGSSSQKNTEAFCSAIEAAGYDAMIYSNMLWEAYELDLENYPHIRSGMRITN